MEIYLQATYQFLSLLFESTCMYETEGQSFFFVNRDADIMRQKQLKKEGAEGGASK